MLETPSWKDLIDMVADTVKTVDENAKRESDQLRDEMAALRNDLNATRSDIMLNRTEMNALRVDMTDMRGKIEKDMIVADAEQCKEIELIKQQAEIEGNRKSKVVGGVVFIGTTIAGLIGKLFGII